jgi:CcmD family protein
MYTLRILSLALALACASPAILPAPAPAQAPAPEAAADAVGDAYPAPAAAAEQPPAQPAGFTRPAGPPRTLRAYWHVFVAFAAAWVLLFGYAVTVGQRMKRLERELETLKG